MNHVVSRMSQFTIRSMHKMYIFVSPVISEPNSEICQFPAFVE